MERRPGVFARVAVWLIRSLWQRRVGPWYGERHRVICRFYPSCSEYAVLAILRLGVIAGCLLAVRRIRRCVPSNCDSCYDPPPSRNGVAADELCSASSASGEGEHSAHSPRRAA